MIFRQVRSAKLSLLSALALITLLLEARLVLRYFKCCHASLLILKSMRSCYIRSFTKTKSTHFFNSHLKKTDSWGK